MGRLGIHSPVPIYYSWREALEEGILMSLHFWAIAACRWGSLQGVEEASRQRREEVQAFEGRTALQVTPGRLRAYGGRYQ